MASQVRELSPAAIDSRQIKNINDRQSKKSLSSRRLIYGWGINDADYKVRGLIGDKKIMCPYYSTWHGMVFRCHSERYKKRNPTYKNCSVDIRWRRFSEFKKWMEKQRWQGNSLDKDILYPGNKIYSPETCLFIGQKVNCLLQFKTHKKRDLPRGVIRVGNKFLAQITVNSLNEVIGWFDTPQQAEAAYLKKKIQRIKNVADQQSDKRIAEGLLRHAKILEEDLSCC